MTDPDVGGTVLIGPLTVAYLERVIERAPARRAAADPGRADRAEPGGRARRRRRPGALRRAGAGHAAGGGSRGRGSRRLPRPGDRHRRAGAGERGRRDASRTGCASSRQLGAPGRGPAGIHARRRRGRLRLDAGRGAGADRGTAWRRAPSARCWSSAACWAGTRSSSRCCATRRHHDRDLRHGEPRPDGRPHRRLDRGGADPDPLRPGRAAAAPLRAEDRARAAPGGRLQRPAGGAPDGGDYRVIEVNPRVSRSPRAGLEGDRLPDRPGRRADRASGKRLHELPNPATGIGLAAFEPAVDYVVVKLPRWPFDKFPSADRSAGDPDEGDRRGDGHRPRVRHGAAEGDPLARAARPRLAVGGPGVGPHAIGLRTTSAAFLEPTDTRLWRMVASCATAGPMPPGCRGDRDRAVVHRAAGRAGRGRARGWWARRCSTPSGRASATPTSRPCPACRRPRCGARGYGPGCARPTVGSTPAPASSPPRRPTSTPATRGPEVAPPADRRSVIVVGSGPIRIGQGIEFDYCSVRAAWAIREMGLDAVVINNNPETVSTDYDACSRLYFEPLDAESVLDVIDHERALTGEPPHVVLTFGGQTAIDLAKDLAYADVPIAGLTAEAIEITEDRERFAGLLDELGIEGPRGQLAADEGELRAAVERSGLPVIVRPVVGDRRAGDRRAAHASGRRGPAGHRDRLAAARRPDGGRGRARRGRHQRRRRLVRAGDPGAARPARGALGRLGRRAAAAAHLARASRRRRRRRRGASRWRSACAGILNVQMIVADDRVVVIEANPRASRTVPIVAKATGRDVVAAAVRCALGATLAEVGLAPGLALDAPLVAVKTPIGSLWRLPGRGRRSVPRCARPARCWGWRPTTPAALEAARQAEAAHLVPGLPCRRCPPDMVRELSRLRYGGSRTATAPRSDVKRAHRSDRRDRPRCHRRPELPLVTAQIPLVPVERNTLTDALSGLASARIVPQEGPRRTLPATKSAAHAASVSGGVAGCWSSAAPPGAGGSSRRTRPSARRTAGPAGQWQHHHSVVETTFQRRWPPLQVAPPGAPGPGRSPG